MPFTFSHPAAVLPFGWLPKRWVSVTGMVMGSMVPDFDYFLRMNVDSTFSHSFLGLFVFDFPVSILLAFLFHLVVRNSLIDHLPLFLTQRLLDFKQFDWMKHFQEHYTVVIASVFFGAITHIVWDNFTHEHGHFVYASSHLKGTVSIFGHPVYAFKLLQHLSTVVGGAIVLFALLLLPADKNYSREKSILPYWLFTGFIAVVVLIGRIWMGIDHKFFESIMITAIAGGLTGIVITSKLAAK